MITKRFFIFLILLFFFSSGCSGASAKPSPSTIKSITTKPIEGTYEDIFNSSIAAFEELGFKIKYKEMDMDSAIILAELFDEEPWSERLWQRVWYGYIYNRGVELKLSCRIEKVTDDYSDVKVFIQETAFAEWGSKKDTHYVYYEDLYRDLFEGIKAKLRGLR